MNWNVDDDRVISTSTVVLAISFVISSSFVLSSTVDDSVVREISTATCFSYVFLRRVWWTSWMRRKWRTTTTTWTRRTFVSGLCSSSVV